MIAIVDYGAGNIFSIENALSHIGADYVLTGTPDELERADAIILPGVGAFPAAMEKLEKSGLIPTIIGEAKKKPFLGICLGMQLLFERSFEFSECRGLGLLQGYVDRIDEPGLIIPHMGWNKLETLNECPLTKNIGDEAFVYFVHSFRAFCDDSVIASYCEYGSRIPALVSDGKYVFGAQFHPEKSGETGLKILRNFISLIGDK